MEQTLKEDDLERAIKILYSLGCTTSKIVVRLANDNYPNQLDIHIGKRFFEVRMVSSTVWEKYYVIKRRGRSIYIKIIFSSPRKAPNELFSFFRLSIFDDILSRTGATRRGLSLSILRREK